MRLALRFLGVFVFLVCFPAGAFALFFGWHLQHLQRVAQPEPQTVALADLIGKDPPANAYIELTGYRCGTPILEKEGGRIFCAWIPLLPGGKAKKPVYFRAGGIGTQASLDALLKQETLTALVGNSFPPHTVWTGTPDKEFKAAHAELANPDAIFLTELDLDFFGVKLGADELFNPDSQDAAQWTGGGLISLGVLCVLLAFFGGSGKDGSTSASQEEAQAREVLKRERPLSVHYGLVAGAIRNGLTFVGGAFVFGAVGLVALGGAASMRTQGGQLLVALLALGTLAGAVICAWYAYAAIFRRVDEFVVCPSGLRWSRRDTVYTALWHEIRDVERKITIHTRRGEFLGRSDHLVIKTDVENFTFADEIITQYWELCELLPGLFRQTREREGDAAVENFLSRALAKK